MESCCEHPKKQKRDYLLIFGVGVIIPAYLLHLFFSQLANNYLTKFTSSVSDLINQMWWGVLIGILFVGLIDKVPREFVISILGRKRGISGILRATFAGLLLDLCSHGILLVGMKLYERGASLGQTMAFLIASPWNSFSLTLILWALIGFKWMLAFLMLSAVIAVISGLIFEKLVNNKVLPDNPNAIDIPENFVFFKEAKQQIRGVKVTPSFFKQIIISGFKGSKMVLRWIFFGVVLASLMRTFISPEHFHAAFGPTLLGLFFTLVAATVIEVCSEGATPIAADIFNIASAPGNAFAFLMSGVATDYTEVMALKETTKSWKIALFLPLVTLPQVALISYLMNFIK
ncbi:MAG: permease [Rickettsiaceae bacterium]|jgi:uncharacterized membrane protein YraQ (UPF0718 family)|nr:permease [Rickettsiaceae bacterium]